MTAFQANIAFLEWGRRVLTLSFIWAGVGLGVWTGTCFGQHKILQRNLKVVQGKVKTYSDLGVTLASGQEIRWENIKNGRVATEKQLDFDAAIKTIGQPRHRFLQRVRLKCYREAADMVDELPSPMSVAWQFRVQCVLSLGLLESDELEKAAFHFLKATTISKRLSASDLELFSESEWSQDVLQDAVVSSHLLPLFFSKENANEVLAKVLNEFDTHEPRIAIYGLALAIAGEQWKQAEVFQSRINGKNLWRDPLAAWLEMKRSRNTRFDVQQWSRDPKTLATLRAFAMWLEVLQVEQTNSEDVNIVPHLRVAAYCRKKLPVVTAAALTLAAQQLPSDSVESRRLRAEISKNFSSNSYVNSVFGNSGK